MVLYYHGTLEHADEPRLVSSKRSYFCWHLPSFISAGAAILLLLLTLAFYSKIHPIGLRTMLGDHEDLVRSTWSTSERANLLNCIEGQSTSKGKDYQKEPLRILMIGDSRMRQQFHSLLSLLPDYDRSWSGPLFDRRIYHIFQHVDTCVKSDILNVEICYWWRPTIDGIGLASEIQMWSSNNTSSGPSFVILSIASHYFAEVTNKNYQEFTEELNKLVDPLHRIIENRNGTLTVVWMLNQIMHSTIRGNHRLSSSYARNKIWNYNNIVQNAFKSRHQVKIVDINPDLADEYVRACQATGRSDFLQFFHCENPVHLGFVLIEENTRFLIRKLICRDLKETVK